MILPVLALFSLNSFALDLAEKHQSLCESAEVKEIIGEKGSCRIAISLSDVGDKQGVCIGKYMGVLPCSAIYISMPDVAGIKLVCGDPEKPALDQIVAAQAKNYTVAAVVTKENAQETVINDPAIYTYFDSNLVKVVLSESESLASGTITLNLQTGPVDLSDVKCQ